MDRAVIGAPNEKPAAIPSSTANDGLNMVRGTVKGLAFVVFPDSAWEPLRRRSALERRDGTDPACSLLAEVCCQGETLVYPSPSPSTLEGAGYKAV